MKCIKQLLFFGLCLGAVQAEEPIYGNSTSPYLEANFFHRVISLTPNKSGVEGCPVIEQEIDEADGFYIEVEKSFGGSFQNLVSFFAKENDMDIMEVEALLKHVEIDLKKKDEHR